MAALSGSSERQRLAANGWRLCSNGLESLSLTEMRNLSLLASCQPKALASQRQLSISRRKLAEI